jgi:hypothetical protein
MGRILGLLLVTLVALARPAAACGEWTMHDVQKGRDITWLIDAGSVTKGAKRLGALYLDDDPRRGLRVAKKHTVVFDVKRGVLRRYGKKIGRIDADGSIVIGKKTYTLAFTDPKDFHGMTAWSLVVKDGDDVAIESDEATALCAAAARASEGKEMSDDEQREEVRLRVAYYLAWRVLGM